MAYQTKEFFTLAAGGTIANYALVKLSGATVIVNTATATDNPVGVAQPAYGQTQYTSTDPDNVNIRDIKAPGLTQVIAAGAITAGVAIYAAASGKVQALPQGAGTYRFLGYAIEAATTDGDVITAFLDNDGSTTQVGG